VGQLSDPHDIAVDSEGNVYAADTDNDRIQKFDPNGTFITKWGTSGSGNGQFSWPVGIAIDNSGNVYVADVGNMRLQKFDPNGTFITQWGTTGSGNGQFSWLSGVAVDNAGNVYVADYGNSRIQKFNPNGAFITKWGTYGSGNGQFIGPWGVAVDNAGNVTSLTGTITASKSLARRAPSSPSGAPPAPAAVNLTGPVELLLIRLVMSMWRRRTKKIIASKSFLPTGSPIRPWTIGQPPILR
jgi:DNA-binding beta-propeller fold protein YncE